MALNQSISRLGSWEGYDVESCVTEVHGGSSWCIVQLAVQPDRQHWCSGCLRPCRAIHDVERRRVRDLPAFEHRTVVIFPRVRLACPHCGPRVELLRWLDPHVRVTRRLGESVARLCKVASVLHVARHYDLDWKTVKALDKAYLERELGPVDLEGIEVIGLDEFAIHKGHRYATVVVEPTCKRVLWIGRGRGREDIRPFVELLGPERCARLKAAVMDMNTGYQLEVRAHCANAALVFDLFHVVAKYGREVIDRVRVDRANELRADPRGRHIVKGARWLLLKNRDSLRPGEDVELNELLSATQSLFVVYVLRDALKDLRARNGRSRMEQLVSQGTAQRYRAVTPLRQGPQTLPARHPRPLPVPPRHQPDRGHQQ